LLIRLARRVVIEPGALGRLDLPAGHYVYVGSAMGGLKARVRRHLRRAGRVGGTRHWHVDSLLERVGRRAVRALPIPSRRRLECALARDVARRTDGAVPGFGCTDCRCPSHLLHFREDPLAQPPFLALLRRYRCRPALGPATRPRARAQAGSG